MRLGYEELLHHTSYYYSTTTSHYIMYTSKKQSMCCVTQKEEQILQHQYLPTHCESPHSVVAAAGSQQNKSPFMQCHHIK